VTFHQSPRQPEEDLKRHIRYLSTISNGWLTMEISIEMDDFGVPLFKETSIWGIEQFLKICFTFQEYRDFDTNAMTIIIIVNHLKCSSFIWMIVTNGPLLSSTPQHRFTPALADSLMLLSARASRLQGFHVWVLCVYIYRYMFLYVYPFYLMQCV
jgi:hypothetical protein